MLYLLLHVVFSDMAKQWWLFMLIGYGKMKYIKLLINSLSLFISTFCTVHHYSDSATNSRH